MSSARRGVCSSTYTALVSWSVRHYLSTICVGLILFAASIWSMGLLPKGFLPAQDAARSLLAIELPPGSQLADTERKTEDIVALLRKRPEVKSVFVDGGRVAHTLEVRKASLIINYTPKSSRSVTQHQLELLIGRDLADVPDIHYWFLDENGLRAVSLFVSGADSRTVDNVANELARQMQRVRADLECYRGDFPRAPRASGSPAERSCHASRRID